MPDPAPVNTLTEVPRAVHDAEIALAQERGRREGLERAMMGRPAAAPPSGPPEPDFVDEFVNRTKLPKEEGQVLRRGMEQTVKRMMAPVLDRMGRAINERVSASDWNSEFNAILRANPDMDAEKFAAASSAAEYDLRKRGVNWTPSEYLNLAVAKYRTMFPNPAHRAPAPDYVEGGSDPSRVTAPGRPRQPEEEPLKNPFEEWYPDNDEEIIDLRGKDPNEILKGMTDEYSLGKNVHLEDKGMRSLMPRVAVPLRRRAIQRRKAEKAKAAAAAGR